MAEHVTIITGASRGVGRATAVELCRRGGAVALVARDKTLLGETARLCEASGGAGGGEVLVAPADITREPELRAAVSRTIEAFGRLDGVVNNAGYAPQAGVEETDAPLFEKTLAVNLSSAMALSRLAWPHLKRATAEGATASPAGEAVRSVDSSRDTASPSGEAVAPGWAGPCIVNVSSMAAVDPLPGFVAYAAAKAGLLGLTKALAREGDAHGIRSVAIILGGVETEMFRGLKGVEGVPAEALLRPEEVGRVIAECLTGPLAYSSGEAVYLRKRV
jgi:NAD(P)-dependent dehydrogenase (short-subunit alcohol dehydrogenase family)